MRCSQAHLSKPDALLLERRGLPFLWAACWLISIGLGLSSCDHKRPRVTPASSQTDPAPPQVSTPSPATNEAEARQRAALDAIRTAVREFAKAAHGTESERLAAYTKLKTALDTEDAKKDKEEVGNYRQLVAPIAEIAKQIDALDESVPLPELPEKPTYEKPEYGGAWYLAGEFRGRFKDGIVVQRGSKYYVVENASPPVFRYVTGFVEHTGGIEILAIGRDGRTADVVKIADRETYYEDQANYRKQVVEAKQTYQGELKEYEAALRLRKKAEAEEAKRASTRERDKLRLQQQRQQVLIQAATKLEALVLKAAPAAPLLAAKLSMDKQPVLAAASPLPSGQATLQPAVKPGSLGAVRTQALVPKIVSDPGAPGTAEVVTNTRDTQTTNAAPIAAPTIPSPDKSPEGTDRYAQAQRLLTQGKAREAQAIFQELSAETPSDARIEVGLAACAAATHRFSAALEHYNQALFLSPDQPQAIIGMADTYAGHGDAAHAKEWYEKYLESYPDGSYSQRARTRLNALSAQGKDEAP